MKKTLAFLVFFSFLISTYCSLVCANSQKSSESVSEIIRKNSPTEFGYLDNTEYYMQFYFSQLSFVDDCCIVTCNESTNFNEFGVFHVNSASEAKQCKKHLTNYITEAKERFKNGIVYDVSEYPKFENAQVIIVGDFVIYMILDAQQTKAAIQALRQELL